jgi:hypothetical protein
MINKAKRFSVLILTLTAIQSSSGERINICNYQTFEQQSGVHCNFTTAPGEWIHVWARYRDTSPGSANVTLNPFGNNLHLNSNQQGEIVKKIGMSQVGNSSVTFNVASFALQDYVDIDVWRDRSNLRALVPWIDPNTGTLYAPWAVTSSTQFSTNGYVYVETWAGDTPNPQQMLRQWGLAPCINQGNCSNTYTVPLAERAPIDRGKSWLITKIDPTSQHAELDENDNHAIYYMDDFFSEKVPGILLARGPGWEVGSRFLDTWFDGPRRSKDSSISGIDWTLPIVNDISYDTSWLINPANAANNRVINAYTWITNPAILTTPNARLELKSLMDARFETNPGATTLLISRNWPAIGIRNYHKQHIQSRAITSDFVTGPIDQITAAMGNFSLYLVPKGTVTRTQNTYNVSINAVAVHASDSFDFNGTQPLGCWALPSNVLQLWLPGYECLFNSSFRYYRRMKARGGDFNVFFSPITIPLPSPINLTLPR